MWGVSRWGGVCSCQGVHDPIICSSSVDSLCKCIMRMCDACNRSVIKGAVRRHAAAEPAHRPRGWFNFSAFVGSGDFGSVVPALKQGPISPAMPFASLAAAGALAAALALHGLRKRSLSRPGA